MEFSDKQQQILASAERLFAKSGYEGTSVRDIAEDAGVNTAMISYYFGSKEKLMEALFEQRTQYVKLQVDQLMHDDTLEPLQKMEAIVTEYVERVVAKMAFYKIMVCEQVVNKNPVIMQLIAEMKKKNSDEIARIIALGQRKKVFKKQVDILLLMNSVTGAITQMMLSLDYYKTQNNLHTLPPEKAITIVKQKLSTHLHFIIKALLTHEL